MPHTALGGAQHVPLPLRVLAVAALLGPQAVVLAVQGAAPLLLREAPLVLLALHPFAPWSLLVSTRTDPAAFVAVIVAVRTIPCLGGYFVGRWYGARALDWLSRNPRTRRVTATAQRISARAGAVLLVVYPGATSSVLAGVNAMPVRRFLPLALTGLTLAALLARVLATAAAVPLILAAGFVDQYAIPLGVALLVGVVVSQVVQRRRRAG